MAIIGVCGLMGGGKSYYTTKQILIPALKSGRPIVTNIPLTDEIYNNSDFDPQITILDIEDPGFDRLTYFDEENIIKGAIYVIDECQDIWPGGLKASQLSKGENEFLTKHRHMVGENGFTTEIVLITQDFGRVASCVRTLIDSTYRCIKLNKSGMNNRFRVDVYNGIITGQRPPETLLLNTFYGKYEKDVFKYYQSQTKNTSDHTHGMEKAGTSATVWQNPLVYIGIPLSIIIVIFSSYKVLSFFSPPESTTNSTEENINTSISTLSLPATKNKINIENNNPYKLSTKYRIMSVIKSGTDHYVLISDNVQTFPLPYLKTCKEIPYLGTTCNFFGENVTFFSGQKPVKNSMIDGILK